MRVRGIRTIAGVIATALTLAACASTSEPQSSDGVGTMAASGTADAAAQSSGDASDSGETFELQFASYNVPNAVESEAQKEWAKRVEAATDGRVKVTFYFQEALLKADDTLQGVADGRADMGWVAIGYYPGELPLTSVVGIPFLAEDAMGQGATFAKLYASNEAFSQEWERLGVKVLNWNPSTENIIASKKPVTSFNQIAGMKIRGFGYISEALSLAQANVVALTQPEVYEALQHGVLDATSGASMNIAIDRKFEEVAPHFVDAQFGSYSITADVISLSVWSKLPADIQQAILAESNAQPDYYADFLADANTKACDALLGAGGDIAFLPSSETEAWRSEAVDTIKNLWRESAEKAGIAGADIDSFYDAYVDTLRQNSKADDAQALSPMRACADRPAS